MPKKTKSCIRCDNKIALALPEAVQLEISEIGTSVLTEILSGRCIGILVYTLPQPGGSKKLYINAYDDHQDVIRAAALGVFSDSDELKEVMKIFKVESNKTELE